MQSYIAVLDRSHLENSLFLKSFAHSLSKHGNRKGIILHGDSDYTDRIMQQGVMREEAQIRATKDLNRRLIGLLADHGVSAIGLHAYQRELVVKKQNELNLNMQELNRLPEAPCLVISNLIADEQGKMEAVDLPSLSALFKSNIPDSEIVIFSLKEADEIAGIRKDRNLNWTSLPEEFLAESVPQEFRNFREKLILSTSTGFEKWPNDVNVTKIV